MKSFFKSKPIVILFLIFLLALFLRLFKLGSLPAIFYEDEVLSGYIGRYILSNGKDIYGNTWPLFYFNKFGDYYIILPIYLSGLATYIFGVNEFATRFFAAFIGALVTIPVYFFTLKVFKNKTVGLLSALLIAILPWHLVLARATTESVIEATSFLGAIALFLYSIKAKQRLKYLLPAFFLFFISYFVYHTARIYIPLTLLASLFIFKEIRKDKKQFSVLIFATFVFFVLTVLIGRTKWGKGRFMQTSIFGELSGVTIRINEAIFNLGGERVFEARLFHNKVIGFGKEFIHQYLTYFSPVYLFINAWQKTRYEVPETGPVYLTFIFLFILAVLPLKNKKLKINQEYLLFLLFLLLLAPFPASLTYVESPNVRRSLFLAIPLVILAAFGLYKSHLIKWKRIPLSALLSIILIGEFIFFWHQYSTQFDMATSFYRCDGQSEIAKFALQEKDNYDKIYLPNTKSMSWYYLFYKQDFDPDFIGRFQLDAKINNTGNVFYKEGHCPSESLTDEELRETFIAINKVECVEDERLEKVKEITGVNWILVNKVLAPKR
ncbi:MAG: glycosyltransferase family 39 protein [Candidatus Woesebacteria bacterium]|jgi:4-amino-4-deoxy-L-arabinose transferase-like glycosyltransferase